MAHWKPILKGHIPGPAVGQSWTAASHLSKWAPNCRKTCRKITPKRSSPLHCSASQKPLKMKMYCEEKIKLKSEIQRQIMTVSFRKGRQLANIEVKEAWNWFTLWKIHGEKSEFHINHRIMSNATQSAVTDCKQTVPSWRRKSFCSLKSGKCLWTLIARCTWTQIKWATSFIFPLPSYLHISFPVRNFVFPLFISWNAASIFCTLLGNPSLCSFWG